MSVVKPIPQELETVIAVRHGKYDLDTNELNQEGAVQIRRLAERILELVPSRQRVAILTSPALRAIQSAKIIGGVLKATHKVCEELSFDNYESGQVQMKAVLAKLKSANIVIVVAHSEAPVGIVHAFAQASFGGGVSPFICDKGNGCMLHLKTGEVKTNLFD